MLGEVRETTTRILSRVQIRVESPDASDEVEEMTPPAPDFSRLTTSAATSENAEEPAEAGDTAVLPRPMPRRSQSVDRNDPSTWGKVARNAPCPCGSGKKFKHCHGRS
jgi:preprotein translocase subunit SecA